MKADEIMELFRQFESIANDYEGVECWSARELSKLLGYTQWRNFENIVEKAKAACRNAGQNVSYHFADVSKMIDLPKSAQREVDDLRAMHVILSHRTEMPGSRKSLSLRAISQFRPGVPS